MKKTYTRCKVGLFVGLLALHTLSSCSNKGQELGVNFSREQFGLTGGQVRRNYNANPRRCICNKLVMPCLGFVATGLAIGGSLYWLLSEPNQATSTQGTVANGTEPSIDQITDNATALATTVATTLGTGLVNLGNTTVAPMVTTAATAAVTAAGLFTTAAGLMTTRLVNGLHSNRSYPEDSTMPINGFLNGTGKEEPFNLPAVHNNGSIFTVDPTEVSSNGSTAPPNLENSPAFVTLKNRLARGEVDKNEFEKAISEGLSIDEQDVRTGKTLLMLTQSEAFPRSNAFTALIDLGANVNIRDNSGKNVAMYLTIYSHLQSSYGSKLKKLINAGADLNRTDNKGRSTLHLIKSLSPVMPTLKEEIERLEQEIGPIDTISSNG